MSIFALQILLVGGATQGLCLALLLATRHANPLANRLLALLMLLVSAQSVLVAFDTREFFLAFPHLSRIGWLLPSLFGPLLYLFTRKLTSPAPRLRRADAWHLLPFALVLAYLLPYYLQPAAAKIAYLRDFQAASRDDFGWLNQLLNLEHIGYLLAALHALRRHGQRIRDEFSDLTRLRLRWLRQFLLFTLGIVLVGVAAFYGRKWGLSWISNVYHFHYLGVIGLIYWIGYRALAQPELFSSAQQDIPPGAAAGGPNVGAAALVVALEPTPAALPAPPDTTAAPAAKYQKSTLTPEQAQEVADALLAFMRAHKPYRQNSLTIQELARQLELPKHRLSQVLNEQLGKNFYDFVNEYRVEEVKHLLRDPRYAHYSTLGIAEEAGFNSKATFNAVFKKITGVTPSEYAKQSEIGV
ncbi:helix-turn-helix domain-containing protein [Hymenobacter cellulosivorans]|uniref:Helix-turn-helix domain-containing protein n=1 Tax=Hymenobacter cellulosivorans TaxID=2932249 RepID=A0ABY4F6E7_9BACT|nr:helix-turn-helix domain-containing protein [Hymenobacter cellulosivorans]UOQ52039.1 helix-turn-helix domain-containing protein [Hymenobacter cellulosivorans]